MLIIFPLLLSFGILINVSSTTFQLRQALHAKNSVVSKNILQLQPQLRFNYTQIPNRYLDQCYDQTVDKNGSVNIFEDTVRKVTNAFFKHHVNFIKDKNVQEIISRIDILIINLYRLAKNILQCASDAKEGKNPLKLGLTSMICYSREEFKMNILNSRLQEIFDQQNSILRFYNHSDKCSLILRKGETLPPTWNWADQHVLSPIYSQHDCQSCYVMASTDALETQYRIHHKGKSLHLSVQATLNCMDSGCYGGSIQQPFDHMVRYGVPLDAQFPYKSKTDNCTSFKSVVKPAKYCYHVYSEDREMQLMVWRNGPAVVAISAPNSDAFSDLKDKIWTGDCSGKLNHVVLLVGWTKKYWIVKNTWGEFWADGGYVKIPMAENKCMINSMLGVPLLER